jgi:hypothetical protein
VRERDDAPVSTDVRDARHPAQRGILERRSRGPTTTAPRCIAPSSSTGAVEEGHGGRLLVEEEYLGEDLGWDAARRGEGVAACADGAQRAEYGGHFAVDEVEGFAVRKRGRRYLLYDVVDEDEARLDGVGPVSGGPGVRNG